MIANYTDLKDKVILVTGGARGIGKSICLALASQGAHVVFNYRGDEAKASALKEEIQSHGGQATALKFDVTDYEAMTKAIDDFTKNVAPISGLVNNAGIMFGEYQVTADGFESQMATNHFGHFALTGQLLPMLIASQGRIVNVSSIAHRRGEIDFDNLQFQKPKSYTPLKNILSWGYRGRRLRI